MGTGYDDVERTVEEFLDGQPRAKELAEMRRVLQQRLEGLRAAARNAVDPAEQARLRREIESTERHVAALAREELITEFVEDSVRATLLWSRARGADTEE
ncbi:MAG: hypothetical protein QHJ73_13255 [Armatimonadota bacterium]|jgi:hypothetical protein|nr:hypothetical protein [Armatimonadota bacterium]